MRQHRWTTALVAILTLLIGAAPAAAAAHSFGTTGAACHPITVRGQVACLEIVRDRGAPVTASQRTARAAEIDARLARQAGSHTAGSAAVRAKAVPTSFPSSCLGAVTSTDTVLYPDRFHSCSSTHYSAILVSGGNTIGTAPLTVLQWTTDYAANLGNPGTWDHGVDVTVGTTTGLLVGGAPLSFTSLCTGASSALCSVASTSGSQPVPYTTGSETTVVYTETDAGPANAGFNAVTADTSKLGILWTFPWGTNVYTWTDNGTFTSTGAGLANRCDSYTGIYSGTNASAVACVDEQFVPTLVYSAVANPTVADVATHVYNAQAALPSHWGVPAHGNWLSRDTSIIDQSRNRSAACTGVPPSCDEFPMASTYQGAYFSASGDWSAATVSSAANNSQGGITGNFYTTNRVVDGDKFWVQAILANGNASW